MTRSLSHPVLLAAATAVVALGGCSADGRATAPGPVTRPAGAAGVRPAGVRTGTGTDRSVAQLESFGSCDDLVSWTKARLRERVTAYGLGGPYPYPYGDDVVRTEEGAATTAVAAGAPLPSAAPAGGTSTTNTQEAGVDEGDIVETDGRYVYSVVDGHLRSVDLDAGTLLADLEAPQGDQQMLLDGDALLIVTQSWSEPHGDAIASRYVLREGVPTLAARTHLEGSILATRAIDGVARLVLSQPLADRLPFVVPRAGGEDDERDALAENRRVIEALTADQLLPRRYSEDALGTTGAIEPALDCDRIGHPSDFSGFGLVWVATIDLHGDADPQGAAGVVADGQTVYASPATLYVATIKWPDVSGSTVPVRPEPARTALHAFDLHDPAGAHYLASGEVPGTVINQYALSEYDGHLRVATTTDAGGFGSSQESGVHVLERRGSELVEVGAVGGLGRNETIQAVRYLGDRAYVVTFRQTDPLFVLDLSDPAAPRLVGQLKIPGFSSYLHPIDDHLLLGMGFDATDTGGVTGSQLSLFDVSDPAAPVQLSTLDVGQISEAAFDPHAFLWWAGTGQVVVPKELVCTVLSECTSAVVARVDGSTLVEQGRLFQWYPIRRSLVAQGRLVTVSAGGVRVHDLTSLDELERIDFGLPDGAGLVPG